MSEINPKSAEIPRLGSATQIDVARRAGVSTATVSRVLNGSPLVSAGAREKVEAAIRELAYLPHEAARSLATRRSRTLGAIIPTLTNAIFAAGVNAFEDEARARGHALFIAISNYDPVQEGFLIRQMVERGVDGLLLVGNDRGEESRAMLAASGLRCACAWAYDEEAALANVGFDNAAAMGPLVDHLVATGRRRIAVLAGVLAGNDRARGRIEGVADRLEAHGLAPIAVRETRYSIRRAKEAARALLDEEPDAIVCGNDVIAYGALAAARGRRPARPRRPRDHRRRRSPDVGRARSAAHHRAHPRRGDGPARRGRADRGRSRRIVPWRGSGSRPASWCAASSWRAPNAATP